MMLMFMMVVIARVMVTEAKAMMEMFKVMMGMMRAMLTMMAMILATSPYVSLINASLISRIMWPTSTNDNQVTGINDVAMTTTRDHEDDAGAWWG